MSTIQPPYDVFRALLAEARDYPSYFRCFVYLRDHPTLFSENVMLRYMVAAMLAHFSMELMHDAERKTNGLSEAERQEFSEIIMELSMRLPPPENLEVAWPTRLEPAENELYPFDVRRM